MQNSITTKRTVILGIMAAISLIFMYAIRFPIFPAAPFLMYDAADIPIFITTFLYGPIAGAGVTVVVSILQALTASTDGWIGGLMHIFATGSYALIAGWLYQKLGRTTFSSLIISSISGIIMMTTSMIFWNLLFTPIFMGTPIAVVMQMLVPIIIPFNLIKAGVNSVFAVVLYKAIGKIS